MQSFDEARFNRRLERSLVAARRVLDSAKSPTVAIASSVSHSYRDKFFLADMLTCNFISSTLDCIHALGFTEAHIDRMRSWYTKQHRSVYLKFSAKQSCKFLRTTTEDVDSTSKNVTEVFGVKITNKTVTSVTTHFYQFDATYSLSVPDPVNIFGGSINIRTRSSTTELKCMVKSNPYPAERVVPDIEVDISWLLMSIDDAQRPNFTIDRTHEKCFTPRRNYDIDASMNFSIQYLRNFCSRVLKYFKDDLFNGKYVNVPIERIGNNELNIESIFDPVMPLLMDSNDKGIRSVKDSTSSSSSSSSSAEIW